MLRGAVPGRLPTRWMPGADARRCAGCARDRCRGRADRRPRGRYRRLGPVVGFRSRGAAGPSPPTAGPRPRSARPGMPGAVAGRREGDRGRGVSARVVQRCRLRAAVGRPWLRLSRSPNWASRWPSCGGVSPTTGCFPPSPQAVPCRPAGSSVSTCGCGADYVASIQERAETAERERDSRAQVAVAAERARIAREMHDVIAHSLSVMITLNDAAAAVETVCPGE